MTAQDDAQTLSLPEPIAAALGRFATALDRLEATAARRSAARAGRADGDEEAALMRDDRARLAAELDAALARTTRLMEAHAQAMARLDRAEETIRAAAVGLGAGRLADGDEA